MRRDRSGEGADVGVDGPTRYILKELVAGASLRKLLTARPHRSPNEWLSVAADIVSALAAAHAAGVVQRDVKPENIMVVRRRPCEDAQLRARRAGRRC